MVWSRIMPISPDEISAKRFVVTLRGYDRAEVDSFLRAVASDQARLLRRLEVLEQKLAEEGPGAVPAAETDEVLASVLEEAAAGMSGLRGRFRRRRSEDH